ncbi:WXG100-like domain-containing protein [Streptomyces celluloflavus]|uniref:WXG100-like domain-containing protein n=1 Tax=Streptomyces celluloflavus TaxID=58344 RepID=UPI003659B4B8
MLPKEVDWILDLLGFNWPDADEDKMWEAAEGWSAFATAVRQYQADGIAAANAVRGANSGEAIEAFDEAWKKFAGGGDGYLDEVIEAAEILSFALNAVATIVLTMKIAVIAQLIALAIEFAIAQAAAPVTLGASEIGAAAATQTTRMIVRRLLNEAKQKIIHAITEAIEQKAVKKVREMLTDLFKDVGKDMAKGLAQNLVAQGIQTHFGERKGVSGGDAFDAMAKPALDKAKGIAKVGTGTAQMAEGVDAIAHGNLSEGAGQIWAGRKEQAEGFINVAGAVTKDRPAAGEGGGPAPAPTPSPEPTTRSGRDEADRVRNTFG